MNLSPLVLAIPLLSAAVLAGAGGWLPRRITDILSTAAAAAVAVIGATLIQQSAHEPLVYWFGGWKPVNQIALGISFYVDPISSTLATFTATLIFFAFIYTWHYFKEVKSLFHALMLVFMAAMCGLCLSGDLFNLFVWFELMTASAIALCGYKSEEVGPLQGAINFAVMNTVGAFLTLTGIALIYSRTGALNMAQVGLVASQHPTDTFLWISFTFVSIGFLVKAAVVPFHFWLADAHAVAPTPVSALFSGIMVELGFYAVARIYGTAFSGALSAEQGKLQLIFLSVGVISAILGGLMCFLQRHLKRLLAFSTISHVGLMVIALSLMKTQALKGMFVYLLGHGFIKAALFMTVGILLHHYQTVDELKLHGKGVSYWPTGLLVLLGAFGLAGLPPFALFHADHLIDLEAKALHQDWLSWIFMASAVLTSGAVLRFYARIFLGWGVRPEEDISRKQPSSGDEKEEPETTESPGPTPKTMLMVPAILLACSIALPFFAEISSLLGSTSARLLDAKYYQAATFDSGHPVSISPIGANTAPKFPFNDLIRSAVTVLLAMLLASAALFGKKRVAESRNFLFVGLRSAVEALHTLHSGQIGDYLSWFMVGVAIYGIYLIH